MILDLRNDFKIFILFGREIFKINVIKFYIWMVIKKKNKVKNLLIELIEN